MSDSLTTPVLLLLFNRPDTTRRVFAEIRKARPTRLYVAADGPRSHVETDAANCAGAREILNRVDWPCSVQTLLREENLGCKRAVSSALDWFFENEEEGMILEDDCVPAENFFLFSQRLLEYYRDVPRVKMIQGTNVLLDAFTSNESYVFSRYFSVWGWASWRRVWKEFDIEMRDWPRLKQAGWLRTVYPFREMEQYMEKTFDLVHGGQVNTWDAQFVFSCLRNDGLAIAPSVNLISNIGLQGTHTAPGDTAQNSLPVFPLDMDNLKHPREVEPDVAYDRLLNEKLFTQKLGAMIRRILHRAKGRAERLFAGKKMRVAKSSAGSS